LDIKHGFKLENGRLIPKTWMQARCNIAAGEVRRKKREGQVEVFVQMWRDSNAGEVRKWREVQSVGRGFTLSMLLVLVTRCPNLAYVAQLPRPLFPPS
jgi:hypothetical protein